MMRLRLDKIASELSRYFKIPPPHIEFWDYIPDYFSSGVSSSYLDRYGNGFYIPCERRIILELFNTKTQRKYSDEVILHSLAHEFVHHLETVMMGEFTSHRGKFASIVRKVKYVIKESNHN